MKTRSPGRRGRSQAELLSAMILIAATLTIALAAYAYFSSSAAAASSKQSLEIILAEERASTLVSINYMKLNDSYIDYYVLFKKQAANNTPLLFTIAPGRIINPDYVSIEGSLTILQVDRLVPVGGVYQAFPLSPFITIQVSQLKAPPGKFYSFNPSNRNVDVYLVKLTMASNEDMPGALIRIRIDISTSTEKPLLLILSSISNQYYIVETQSMGGW